MPTVKRIYNLIHIVIMAQKTTPKRDITTVAIDNTTNLKLQAFCEESGITKRDFVVLSLDYFTQTKLNPKDVVGLMDATTIENLKDYCNKQKMTTTDFVNAALAYFIESGIDPRTGTNPVLEALKAIKDQSFKQTEQMGNVVQGVTGAVQSMFDTINQATQKQLTMIEEQGQTIQVIEENTTKPKKKHWWQKNKD